MKLLRHGWTAVALLGFIASAQASAAGFTTTDGDGFVQVDGKAFGAPFRLVRPDDWNGELVLLLHGYVFPGDPIALPPVGHEFIFDQLTTGLVTRGFGVAFSSYRVNGYAVREGIIDTRIAQLIYGLLFGRPSDVYLTSFSMGTHIGQRLVETLPGMYDGYLAVCAAVGGATLQNDYFSDARVLFDYFYPGVLPGDLLTADLDFFTEVVPLAIGALSANPGPAFELATILDIRLESPQELFEGIVSSLIVGGGGTLDMQEKARGNPYDNSATVYSGSLDDAALNGGVARYVADRQAARFLDRFYDPNGRLRRTEVLHLHTTRDPIVQLQRHQPVFEQLLLERGDSDQYVVRAVDRFGHCTLSPDEILAGFDDLVLWSRTGVVPAP